MEFYTTEQISKHIIRINPFWKDACMYYIKGSERGLLVDTGYGFGDLKSFVDKLADGQSYDVVISHGHLDHANGAGQWEKVYMSHKDIDLYHENSEYENIVQFLKNYVSDIESYPKELFQAPYDDEFIDLVDGKDFDLGDVSVKTIEAPGHTQGMMVFLIPEERIILFGDACGVFTLFVRPEATSLEEFLSTLSVLKSYENQYDRILRQHGTCESPKELLDEDIEIVHSILNGSDDHIPFEFNGIPCFVARAIDPNKNGRVDGKEGNILYIPEKIRKANR